MSFLMIRKEIRREFGFLPGEKIDLIKEGLMIRIVKSDNGATITQTGQVFLSKKKLKALGIDQLNSSLTVKIIDGNPYVEVGASKTSRFDTKTTVLGKGNNNRHIPVNNAEVGLFADIANTKEIGTKKNDYMAKVLTNEGVKKNIVINTDETIQDIAEILNSHKSISYVFYIVPAEDYLVV